MGRHANARLKAALKHKVNISGKAVPYLSPTEPYKYLGVYVTMTLNWSAQMANVCKAIKEKGESLQGSLASPDQCIRIIQTCIQTVVAYSFPTMAYTPNDIRLMDAMIARTARRCYRLPPSFPTRAVLLPADQYGLGIGSLLPIYVRNATRALTLSMADASEPSPRQCSNCSAHSPRTRRCISSNEKAASTPP